MAEAEKTKTKKSTRTGGDRVKLSKTKKATTRKTKAVKTKKVKKKITETVKQVVETAPVAEKVETARKKRISEKAKERVAAPVVEAIPEVVDSMRLTDLEAKEYNQEEFDELMSMYEGTLQDIKEGEIVPGTVIGVTRDDIIVDVGFKSEGIIPINEFVGDINIKVGDEIEVFLEAVEDGKGQLVLSKQKADFMRVWDRIRVAHDAGDLVPGRIKRRIKGGVVVDVIGVDAFLPGSQIALRQVPDFDALIGETMDVKIIKLNKSRRNIVVSRRVVLEDERDKLRNELLEEIELGQVREGIVKNITDFGVFIDLGGVDGLLHITDMSWGRMRHPSEMVQLGDTLNVKILDFDDKTSRISLGLKQLTPYPWENIDEKYPINKRVKGRVVSITDYGAFVELEKGIEGLIHISEMSWTQHIKHPSKIMSMGDAVEAVVLSVDQENEKISLGIKQMEPDPWLTIHEKYPIGSVVKGRVRNLTAFGAFVEIEEGVDGLVHISDMSWTKRIQHPSEIMKKGDIIAVRILKIDTDNRRVSLGIKQLLEDPWPEYAKKYAVGNEVLGTIMRSMDRGLVVELDGEVEGFVPSNQLVKDGDDKIAENFTDGLQIPIKVIEFDRGARKIVLSIKEYFEKRDRDEYEKFISEAATSSVSLGDSLGNVVTVTTETLSEPGKVEEAAPVAETPTEVVEPASEAAPVAETPTEVAEPASEAAPAEETPTEAAEPASEAAPAEETPTEAAESTSEEAPAEETPTEVAEPASEDAPAAETTSEAQDTPPEETAEDVPESKPEADSESDEEKPAE
ncbi:MAG: 30S ribosomal protein S1 [candidate division Zixibacteria bacterium]